jgi:hypothetical protein
VDWDDDDDFELVKHTYSVVYRGMPAVACSVDEYGNLFFATQEDKINIVSYLDLWSGFTNQYTTIYDQRSGKIDGVTGLDVVDSDDIWFTNLHNTETVGVLNKAEAKTSYINSEEVRTIIEAPTGAHAVSVSDDYAFFVTDDELFMYDIDDEELTLKTYGFTQATDASYGDDKVYVVDHGTSHVHKILIESDED